MRVPKHLSREAQGWWKKITSQCDFDDTAYLLIETMFECYDEFKEARGNLKKYGPLIKAKSGAIHRNPSIEALKIARSQFLQSWRLLNLSMEPPGEIGRPPGDRRRFNDEEDF